MKAANAARPYLSRKYCRPSARGPAGPPSWRQGDGLPPQHLGRPIRVIAGGGRCIRVTTCQSTHLPRHRRARSSPASSPGPRHGPHRRPGPRFGSSSGGGIACTTPCTSPGPPWHWQAAASVTTSRLRPQRWSRTAPPPPPRTPCCIRVPELEARSVCWRCAAAAAHTVAPHD
jgi:hypothetical protein